MINSRLTVVNSGSFFQGRAAWVVLSNIPGGNCGLINVYCPNNPMERRLLWSILPSSIPQNLRWILGGDMNMVEKSSDKTSACSQIIGKQEKGVWETVKSDLDLEDSFKPGRGLKYS